jgi:hypothetical protein
VIDWTYFDCTRIIKIEYTEFKAFVWVRTFCEAKLCIARLDGTTFAGRNISVKVDRRSKLLVERTIFGKNAVKSF